MFPRLMVISFIYSAAFGWAQFAPMGMMNKKAAITLVHSLSAYDSTNSTAQSYTISSTTAGNTLIMGMGAGAGVTVTSISDNGTSNWVSAGARANTTNGSGDMTEIWYAPNVKAGITTVTVHLNSASNLTGWISEVSGLNKTAPLDTVASTTKVMSNPLVGPSVTTTGNNLEFLFTVTNLDSGITAVAAPYTFFSVENGNGAAYSITTTTGTYAPSFTTSGTTGWSAMSSAAFKP